MVGLKKKSKRMTTKRRVKIERKVKEHNRKKRKEARKNPKKGKRKDPGVPSSLPFKETVLKEFEAEKKQAEEERAKKREMLKKKRQQNRESLYSKNRNLTEYVADVEKRQAEYHGKQVAEKMGAEHKEYKSSSIETSRQTYVKEFRKVVDKANIILEVLDARDPLGSRCQELESIVTTPGTEKKLVLILNKIDLIPKENAEAWVKYLSIEFPTVAFKASTQTQSDHLSQKKVHLSSLSESLAKSSHCLGADVLMKLLGGYCQNKGVKSDMQVGVVGFPNTGKSSIINSLKRSKACTVGAMPGVTKAMQEVKLDKHIKLLDSPGVVMEANQSSVTAVLRNVVKLESIEDPVGPVDHILSRCSKEQLMLHYNLPDFRNVDEFLMLLAKRQGRLKKGGIPDSNKAARAVLQDWTSGRISYYTQPPEYRRPIACSVVEEACGFNDVILSGIPSRSGRSPLLVDSLGPVAGIMDASEVVSEEMIDEEGDEEKSSEEEMMEEEEVEEENAEDPKKTISPIVSLKRHTKSKGAEAIEPQVAVLQANKARKKAFKQMKKNRKRSNALAGKLSSALESAFNIGLGDDDDDE